MLSIYSQFESLDICICCDPCGQRLFALGIDRYGFFLGLIPI